MENIETVEKYKGEDVRSVAFVIDGYIVQLMNTDTRLYSILASDPIIVDVTDRPIAKRGLEPFTQYDIETGKIFPPKEYDSWIYNDESERWDPPIEKPENIRIKSENIADLHEKPFKSFCDCRANFTSICQEKGGYLFFRGGNERLERRIGNDKGLGESAADPWALH